MSNKPADSAADENPEADRRTAARERRKAQRRTATDPVDVDRRTGTDRRKATRRKRSMNQYDLEADTLEFINAINAFKARVGRPFPTWSEVLTILRELGYEKQE